MSQAIVVDDLQFAWPDGEVVFEGLSFVVGPGRTGLIGANGSGKSTLLRLVAGQPSPTGGSVRVEGSLGYLRQDLTLDAALPVDEVLGIARARRALAAIEQGQATEDRFAAVGDDWDVEERARATLDRLGLGHLDLDRRVGEVSGGEAVLLGLAAQLLRRPDVLLLDLVDQVADLRDGTLTWHGGNLTAYEAAVAVEQEAAQRLVRTAASDVQRQQRELRDARIKLDRRHRYGQKIWDTKREPKIIMGTRKRQAEVAAGKHRGMQIEKLEQARERLAEATDAVHDDDEIRVDLPGTAVPPGRTVLTVHHARLRARGRQDHPAGDRRGDALPAGRQRDRGRPPALPAPAPGRARRRGQHRRQRGPVRAGRLRQRRPGPPGQVPVPRRPGRPADGHPCRAANGSGPPCCWPNRPRSCCRSTSRPTTWTWPAPASWPRPWPPTAAPWWWPATTCRSCGPSASPAGCGWRAGSSGSTRRRGVRYPRRVAGGEVGMSRVGLLLAQMDEVYGRLRGRLEGLGDDEYFWEPVGGCWTVHRDPSGAWVTDYAEPDPDPAPFTTIGWRLVHLADCKVMYHEWAFGERRLSFPDLAAPPTAAEAMERLEEGQGRLRAALAGLGDDQLDGPRWTNWGERWPAWRILWTMIDHDAHHGAEIGCLRDLYRATAGGG